MTPEAAADVAETTSAEDPVTGEVKLTMARVIQLMST